MNHKYPFEPPLIFCQTRFTHAIDLYDGKDIYQDVVNGQEWKVGKNLHHLISLLPEFIESTKMAEDQALEALHLNEETNEEAKANHQKVMTEVYGNYILGEVYDLSEF